MKNEDFTSKLYDFIGFHIATILLGIPIILTLIITGIVYFICGIFNIEIPKNNETYVIWFVSILVTNAMSFLYLHQQVSKTREYFEKKYSIDLTFLKNNFNDEIKTKDKELNNIRNYCNEINKKK